MIGIPGTEYIHPHKTSGGYQITKRFGKSHKSMGYGKTLIEALVKRDWVIANNWKPYPRTTITNEKHIRLVDNHYKVMKRIKGNYKTYGSFETLEEAVKYRDFIISKCWSTNYIYKNPMRHIYQNPRGRRKWYIEKQVNGKLINFGSFESLEECQKERDLLEKLDWDLDVWCEHDSGEREWLTDKLYLGNFYEKKSM